MRFSLKRRGPSQRKLSRFSLNERRRSNWSLMKSPILRMLESLRVNVVVKRPSRFVGQVSHLLVGLGVKHNTKKTYWKLRRTFRANAQDISPRFGT
jgi:hypothetical protein